MERSSHNGQIEKTEQNALLLRVRGMSTHFFTAQGEVRAVDGMDLQVMPGQILGLVGESGCGKTVSALSIMRLIDPPGRIVCGEVHFLGHSLLDLAEQEMRALRGRNMGMIFQQPQSSLNPAFPIGHQVAETIQVLRHLDGERAMQEAIALLGRVGFPEAADFASAYPHQISGGQAQRVMIAMAVAANPELLIADEPTAALDATIQSQILDLLVDLRDGLGMSILLITHDLGVVSEIAEDVAIMYAGHVIEEAPWEAFFAHPLHPYSEGLLRSLPGGKAGERLAVIPGSLPDPVQLPPACRFAPRCQARLQYRLRICTTKQPLLLPAGDGRHVRCWLYHSAPGHQAPLPLEVT
jgi:peptide/nickel transport system ATP-binding protein